ncbi:MerR family transcriptional regulator [Streptomyces sp. FH025]|uniref:MerR family transcriptional regulator n=1 Tax=Streptomyces sp. FH025 TaxID=2815937 RepID=UPI001A9D1EB0|nr:MerR family transcriptional regulator [Streptomyces sp. FH025]MBO1416636.1 MerR family transcriptional regulator [Streptomyces sp. FH025]
MKIGELSRLTGVNPRLLRYYEEQGLLASERPGGGHRRYAPDAPETVRRIRHLLAAGLPTAVIREVLPCVEGVGADDVPTLAPCTRPYLRGQLDGVNERITELQRSRDSLSALLEHSENVA